MLYSQLIEVHTWSGLYPFLYYQSIVFSVSISDLYCMNFLSGVCQNCKLSIAIRAHKKSGQKCFRSLHSQTFLFMAGPLSKCLLRACFFVRPLSSSARSVPPELLSATCFPVFGPPGQFLAARSLPYHVPLDR